MATDPVTPLVDWLLGQLKEPIEPWDVNVDMSQRILNPLYRHQTI